MTTPGLAEKYGETASSTRRSRSSRSIGAAFGSAVCGKRPVIEIMFGDFLPLVMDGIVNQATKYWYLSNEQGSVPLVVLLGRRRRRPLRRDPLADADRLVPLRAGPQDRLPVDAERCQDACSRHAIRDDNPVLFLEHKRLLGLKGEVDDEPLPFGKARIARAGSDLTIVSVMKGVHDSLAAAERARRATASTARSSTCARSSRSTSRP